MRSLHSIPLSSQAEGWHQNSPKTDEKIAEKCRESYASIRTYIRTKLRFSLLKSTFATIMGVGRIFSRGPVRDFPIIFSKGEAKVMKFGFYPSKLKKQPFFANNFKIEGGLAFHAPPSNAHGYSMRLLS